MAINKQEMINETTANENGAPQSWLRRTAAWFAGHEFWFVLLIILLVFIPPWVLPSYGMAPALIVIAITWFARWLTYGWLAPPNPMNAPLLAILLLTVVGYLVAVDHYFVNQIWVSDTILRVVILFAMASSLRTRQAIFKATSVLLMFFVGLAILSILIAKWDIVRIIDAPYIYDRIPGVLPDLSVVEFGDAPDEALILGDAAIGLNPRVSADMIASILPLALALFIFARGRQLRLPAAIFLLTGSVMLLLSQDIPGLLGYLAAAAFIFFWWRPRLTFVTVLVLVVVLITLAYDSRITLVSRALDIDDLFGIAVVLRLDMWSRALAMIGDMPFSGIGLGSYNLIQSLFYTGHVIGPEYIAHQWFLQTALELGVMGLLAFLWLAIALVLTVNRAYKKVDDRNLRVLLIGVLACAIAFVVDGITVNVHFGLIWITWLPYGLATATFVLVERQVDEQQDSSFWRLVIGWRLLIPFCAMIVLALFLFPTVRERNWGLVQAHQALYSAIESGNLPLDQAEQATVSLTDTLESEPDQAQLYGTRASLYAWQGDQEAALADLQQRVNLDLQDPYGTYAPFVVWKAQVDDESLPDNKDSLVRVYTRWSNRFNTRAEYHVLLAMAMERADGDPARAINRLENGLEAGAEPRALLETYLQQLQPESSGNVVDY